MLRSRFADEMFVLRDVLKGMLNTLSERKQHNPEAINALGFGHISKRQLYANYDSNGHITEALRYKMCT